MVRAPLSSVLAGVVLVPPVFAAQANVRVSVGAGGVEADAGSGVSSVSGDGKRIAFPSRAANLVAGDLNNLEDVFVHDRNAGLTVRVSVSSSGVESNDRSGACVISRDGRFVAFTSYGTTLVAGDANGAEDVFVHDLATGQTTLASAAPGGGSANGNSFLPAIGGDGRFVAFTSDAADLVAGDLNAQTDVFVLDRNGSTLTRASVSSAGAEGDALSMEAAVSDDGRYVAFLSYATNLVAGDTNQTWDVFVRDRQSGTTTRESIGPNGLEADGESSSVRLSADGRYVAFASYASNLVLFDLNGVWDVFVRDRVGSTTTRASVATSLLESDGASLEPWISADGRRIAFSSFATNLDAADVNGFQDVYVRDLVSGTTRLASLDSAGGPADDVSFAPSLSTNGRYLSFTSSATDLVTGDLNGFPDVFVHDTGAGAPLSYCTAGTTTNGCNAHLTASASPSASLATPCVLTATSVEGQRSGLVFYGIDNLGFTPLPWGTSSSFLCVKPPTQRTPPQFSGGTIATCTGTLVLDWNAFHLANPGALGAPWSAGDSCYAQAWFRDPPSAKTTALSDALELTLLP